MVSGADELINKLQAVKDYLAHNVVDVIGVESVNHFKENFQNERFDDGDKWEARSTKRKGTTNEQKVLTKSGELGDSIDYRKEGNDTAVIYSDKKYAQIHNEGFDGVENVPGFERNVKGKAQQVKAHTRNMKMPKRPFMGDSPKLIEKIGDKITRDLTGISS